MRYFKDPSNRLYQVEAEPQAGTLPIGSIEITTEQKDQILAARSATPVVPTLVTMRQARLALLGAGMLSGVDGLIDAMPSPQREAARIEWEYAATVERGSPLLDALAQSLSLDDSALDGLFTAASAL